MSFLLGFLGSVLGFEDIAMMIDEGVVCLDFQVCEETRGGGGLC